MRCPVCNYHDTKVLDSRVVSDGTAIRRRRECLKCGFRFSTNENVEILELVVVKRDGRQQAYDRNKLAGGLRKALEKRPITNERFEKLLSDIERDIQRLKKSEVTSRQIGEIVMKRLRVFDKIAYIRFASVYRSFEDVATFEREIKKLFAGQQEKKRRKISKKHT